IRPKVPHDPCVLHRGTAGRQWAEKRNGKAPSVAGGAQKIPVRVFSARETFGSPAQGGLKNERAAHHSGRAIETAHDNSPETKTDGPWQSCVLHGATACETAWGAPSQVHRRRPST